MSKYELDTKKMKDTSDLILKEIANFESITNRMFDRIAKMPTQTKEWEGEAAKNFAIIANDEKNDEFVPIIAQMRKYANELKTASDGFESVERNTKANDKNISEQ